jgi:DNA-binding response OmpR family regulator
MDVGPMLHCPHCAHQLASTTAIDDVFDDMAQSIVALGERRHVPRREWQILQALRDRLGTFVSPERFYQLIWQSEAGDPPFVEQVLRVHIFKLRRLLAGTPWRIETRWRLGYRLERIW